MRYLIKVEELGKPENGYEKVWNIEDDEETAEVGRKVVDIIATINENKGKTPFEYECEQCYTKHNVDNKTGLCEECARKEFK